MSGFPETPRPVRRLDAAQPIALSDTPIATESFVGEVSKTPIRRLADADVANLKGGRSQTTVWLVMAGIVAGAAGLSYWARRGGGQAGHWKLPATVFQVLGKASVSQNQSVTLLRLGERVLLVSSSGPAMQTLAVVTDPVEVATITSECLSKRRMHLGDATAPRRPAESPAHEEARMSAAVAGRIAPEPRRSSVAAATRGQDHA